MSRAAALRPHAHPSAFLEAEEEVRAEPASAVGPLIPSASIAARSLIAVIAIMTFLSSLTIGAVVLIRTSASDWQAAVSREVTIQIRPADGRDMEAEIGKAVALARGVKGIAEVRPYSREESANLLEPWLGTGLGVEELPIPRMIVVKLATNVSPDLQALRMTLAERVPGAVLDDHRGWIDRLRIAARSAVAFGLAVLGLMLVATMLSVTFATHGTVAANRPIVEVLHFVGARERFIAHEFQRHFLLIGLKGGAVGGIAAALVFVSIHLLAGRITGPNGEAQVSLLFGNLSLSAAGYAGILGVVVLVTAVTVATSRATVRRTLRHVE